MTQQPPYAGQSPAQGLYHPDHEHDACGVGFVVDIKGRPSHTIVRQALQVLINLLHRGACGCEPNTGDGAGILLQMPDKFLRKVCAPLGLTLAPVVTAPDPSPQPPSPLLSIQWTNHTVQISWPSAAGTNWVLCCQQEPASSSAWTVVTNQPAFVGTNCNSFRNDM